MNHVERHQQRLVEFRRVFPFLVRAAEAKDRVPSSIPLADALLCVDDDTIYSMKDDGCPTCGGGSGLGLASVLDRS